MELDRYTVKIPMVCNHNISEEYSNSLPEKALSEIGVAPDRIEEKMKSFSSIIIFELNDTYFLTPTIAVDQWFSIGLSYSKDEPYVVYLECDLLEDGLATLYLWCKQNEAMLEVDIAEYLERKRDEQNT